MTNISHTEFEDAISVCVNNVIRLLKDAKYLFDQEKYPSSISLSILSYEELAKLHFIIQRQIQKKDITKQEGEEISRGGSHQTKLTLIYKDAHQKTQQLTKEQYQKIVESEEKLGSKIQYKTFEEVNNASTIIQKRLVKLNLIKQYCWYVTKTDGKFVTISEIYNKNNLRVLAYWLVKTFNLELLTTILNKKFPNYWMWTIPREVSMLRNDGTYLAIQEIIKEVYSKEFRDISIRASMMLDTFPKKLEDVFTKKK